MPRYVGEGSRPSIFAFLKFKTSFGMALVHLGLVMMLKDTLRWSECKKLSFTDRSVTRSGVEVRTRSRNVFITGSRNVYLCKEQIIHDFISIEV